MGLCPRKIITLTFNIGAVRKMATAALQDAYAIVKTGTDVAVRTGITVTVRIDVRESIEKKFVHP